MVTVLVVDGTATTLTTLTVRLVDRALASRSVSRQRRENQYVTSTHCPGIADQQDASPSTDREQDCRSVCLCGSVNE